MEEKKKPNETVVIGHASGLLYVQAKNTETKDIYICYSSNQATIVESQTDLKANCSWSVKISKEAFDKSRLENNGSAFVGLLRFQNIENKDKTKNQIILNNEVYGITMRANIANLTNSIDMLFTNNDTFPPDVNVTAPHPEASLTYVTHIGCGISIFFLTIALFMHFLLRKAISNQATKILMNMFVALCLLNVLFLSNESVANTKHNGACIFIALVLHYSMLASFTWFFIQALHMYLWLIRQNVTITNYMWKITVLGWVCPTPMVVVIVSTGGYGVVTLNVSSGTITQMCWITDFYIHYIVNIGYYILVFILVAIITVVHARNIIAIDGQRQTFRKQLMMVLSLFLLFGVTWFVAFISYGPMIIPSYYIFTVFNSFSGVWNLPHVDLGETCTNATYGYDTCSEEEASKYILHFNNTHTCEWTCATCDKRPGSDPEKDDENQGVEASDASEFLEKMETEMEEMKNNKHKVQIATGKATGLLHILDENTETKDTCYLTNQNKINVVDCSSILNTNVSWALKIPKEAVNISRQENHGRAFAAVLQFKNMRDKVGKASCVSWDGKGELEWTTSGCETEINSDSIKCSCSHLTFFAVLMSQSNANNLASHLESLTLISSIGCGISMFFLSIALFMHFLLRYSIFIYMCPAPIVIVIASVGGYKAVILNTTSGKITRMCWITNFYIHYIVNIGYYALVFIFTTGIFIIIVTKVVQARIIRATDGKRKTFRKQLMMVLSLFLLFGLTWSVMFFSYGAMIIPSYYIFTVLNSFQGFFLFLYYYHIHNDVAGHFSDDPESTDSNTSIAQSSINAVENIHN
ncbi:adhesion G- coupled receptor G2-like protein [Labeo rohita]|uniref:Adhesion G-coupled receptor G2-like protein n=1 Tax=Labeo rohita TaxID=84645 RepID=A0A498M2V5_LABRO|nr:adhesion G- coupled receptor G2-like protein [Labeo rohita]